MDKHTDEDDDDDDEPGRSRIMLDVRVQTAEHDVSMMKQNMTMLFMMFDDTESADCADDNHDHAGTVHA